MSMADIQAALADLPDQDRGTIAAWLLNSLPPHGTQDASSIEEASRRREELDNATVPPMSADEFWNGIERERAQWK